MRGNEIDFSSIEKALFSLKEALEQEPASTLERDGVIQRFEYTFELCWKMIRRALLALGRTSVSASPKPLLRDALQENWIEDLSVWFKLLEARNQASHTYNERNAIEVYEICKTMPEHAEKLLVALKYACEEG